MILSKWQPIQAVFFLPICSVSLLSPSSHRAEKQHSEPFSLVAVNQILWGGSSVRAKTHCVRLWLHTAWLGGASLHVLPHRKQLVMVAHEEEEELRAHCNLHRHHSAVKNVVWNLYFWMISIVSQDKATSEGVC